MAGTKLSEIMDLKTKTLKELKAQYLDLLGQGKAIPTNKTFLIKRIAYKLQELQCGGLSQAAKEKVGTLIKKYDPINNKTIRPSKKDETDIKKDGRLPIPGTIITKVYKGKTLEVKVLEKGFEYKEKVYRSLSGIAKDVTGSGWNGFLFFSL